MQCALRRPEDVVRHAGLHLSQGQCIQQRIRDLGDHAPPEFRVNAAHTDTLVIQEGLLYRTCVPSRDRPRYYCVIVKPRLPFAQSVVPAGSEPNAAFAQGVN